MDNAPPTQQRITWVYQRYKEGNLELAPPFQRKPVWSLRNKSYLLDTIINGLPVPEIYMQIKTDKSGITKYIIVDGQQRIRAILEFLEGEFEIDEDDSREFGGKEFSSLPDGVKKDIWDYPLVIREIKTDKELEVRGIFQRLNKNVVPLNRQELRNAMFIGHFIKLMNQIAEEDSFFVDNRVVSPNDVKRMIDAEFISELFISMMHGVQAKDEDVVDKFYKMYDDNFQDKEEQYKKFLLIESKISEILGDLRSVRWHLKHDFYALFLAMSELENNYIFPSERNQEIREEIIKFAKDIDNEYETENTGDKPSGSPLVREYFETLIEHSTNKDQRNKRINVVKQILIPFLIAKDTARNFNEEERRIAWNFSKDKKCAVCGKEVEWEDYDLDHKTPHSKGGKTELRNSQITHKSCNASKSNK